MALEIVADAAAERGDRVLVAPPNKPDAGREHRPAPWPPAPKSPSLLIEALVMSGTSWPISVALPEQYTGIVFVRFP